MELVAPNNQDIIVIGASGDLATKKLIPSLYNLEREGLLSSRGNIIGCAIMDWSDEEFREHCKKSIQDYSYSGFDENVWLHFEARLFFVPVESPSDLGKLHQVLNYEERLIYCAVPPSVLLPLIYGIGAAGLADGTSIIVEKPFGSDAKTAQQLNDALHEILPENKIFRIDHYLGKETVQNLLVFRFGNSIFEKVWNRDSIDHVEITVAESVGVEARGKFYEETGAIRDIVQNHLFQLLALITMEPPVSLESEAIRNEKVKVLSAIRPLQQTDVIRGQYVSGHIDQQAVSGYTEEPGVSNSSDTETYAALKIYIDSWRWEGVPFLLRTGKRLQRRDTRVVVVFRDAPLKLFAGSSVFNLHRNKLIIRIQPDEGISLDFVAKQPGPSITTQKVRMDFAYENSFKTSPPEAYERLLHDALHEDHTLFIREDEVNAGWRVVDPILTNPAPVSLYRAGSWGPREADVIAEPSGWHTLEDL